MFAIRYLCLALILCAVACRADDAAEACVARAQHFSTTLHPDAQLDHPLIGCKPLSDDSGQSVLVLPYRHECQDGINKGSNCEDVDVVVLAAGGDVVVGHLFRKDAWWDDAFQFASTTIDTARYKIAPGNRAFGVRVSRRQYHYGGTVEDLDLYAMKGGKLALLLDYLEVAYSAEAADGEGDCERDSSTMDRTLTMLSSANHGLADIRIGESKSHTIVHGQHGRCETKPVTKRREFTLHFDGTRYVAPDDMIRDDF
jgi:hypothetical protein